jgi:PAS domain S-box-containing protein
MAGRRPPIVERETAWRLLGLALGAFAMIAALLFVFASMADRDATLRHGREQAERAAELLAEHGERTLRAAQLAATRLASRIAETGLDDAATLRRAVLTLAEESEDVGSIWVIDPDGRPLVASVAGFRGDLDLSDRDYVQAIRAGAGSHVMPMTLARATGLWIHAWSEAVRVDGELKAIVHVALRAERLARFAERLAAGAGAELTLLREDGAVLSRWPLPPTAEVPPQAPPVGASGFAVAPGPDGATRLSAWRAGTRLPIVAVVSLPEAALLAAFRERTLRNALVFVISILLAGGLASAAMRAARREAEAKLAAEQRGAALSEVLSDRLGLLASLREGEARLRMAQQAGGVGLWDLDLDDRRVVLAGEVFGEWGLRGAEQRAFRAVPVRAVLRAIHGDDRGAVVDALTAALRGSGPLSAEFRLAGPGPARWIGVRAEPRAGPETQARRLLGIARDVTAERLAQQAAAEARAGLERRVRERTGALAEANARLREGEARFRGLFNATFQFIGLLSPDGTVLEANAAMLRLGGARAGAVIGAPYWSAPWWPQEPATEALLREAVAEAAAGRFMRRETAMLDAAGRAIAVDFSVTPVRDEDGIVSLLVAEARDVSALKAAQALLHEAQKMDTLGQLTGGVAHDFNNLLMAILGNLAIARKRAEGRAPELLRQLDAATQAAERGATLTQRLLAFARRQDLKPAAVDLRALLAGLEALLRRSAGPLVAVEIEAPSGLPPAHVDPHALELALVNLAVNARDAMPGGGRLSVRLALAEGPLAGRGAPGRWLTLAVADNGTGMDDATLSRAVEPFFTTKGPGQGTGLGLSMVHGLAAQSGGALMLESAPGRGTTATLWLPVSAMRPEAGSVQEAAPSRGRGAILVVDDEALVLESTAAMLEELGYEPVAAGSGEAALALLAARRDLVAVLTDHAMPGMTGAVLAQRLNEERPGLPVILATGYAGTWSEEGEARPRLAKPYSLTQLSQALSGVLARAAA